MVNVFIAQPVDLLVLGAFQSHNFLVAYGSSGYGDIDSS